MRLSEAARQSIREEMARAGRGERTAMARRLAEHYGISVSSVYKAATPPDKKRRRNRQPERPEYEEWVRIAVQYRHRAPKPVALNLAIEAAVAAGALPSEALDMPPGSAYRVRRRLGLDEQPRRHARLYAEYPMQVLLFDGSTSEFLTVVAPTNDGDWLLKLHRRPYSAGGYKNKPLGSDRNRVVAYGIWDMCTGYTRSVYTVAKGENALDSARALCDMLAETGDPRRPMHGVPDTLCTDQGPLFKAAGSRDLLERLDVELDAGSGPYMKERMGGVERPWRSQWAAFERALFLRDQETLLLSELNARLVEYEARVARRRSRTDVGGQRASRADAWSALTRSARPSDRPLKRMPPNAIETAAKENPKATIDRAGIISWDNRLYECKEWHGRKVRAYRPLDADAPDRLVLVDRKTGERTTAEPLKRRLRGDVRAQPKTPLDKLLEETDPKSLPGADIYAPGSTPAEKVSRLPAKSAPPAPLENPLDADRLPSLREAMRLFREIYTDPLSPENRAAVVAHIEAAGLSRRAVEALAQRLIAPTGTD